MRDDKIDDERSYRDADENICRRKPQKGKKIYNMMAKLEKKKYIRSGKRMAL